MTFIFRLIVLIAVGISTVSAQVSTFPYVENFDGVTAPALPTGWGTSTNRIATGDFVTSVSTPRSTPNTVFSQNAQVTQFVVSPVFDFTNRTPDQLSFYTARSATHTAGLLLEASLDGGTTFSVALSDTIRNPGVTSYVLTSLPLPQSLANRSSVRIRWRIVATAGGGSTATFRLDDVSLTVQTSFDIAVVRLRATPAIAPPHSPLSLSATVRNLGTQSAAGYSVRFTRDINRNNVADPAEEFASQTGAALAAGDSTTLTVSHPSPGSGVHRFHAVVIFPPDEHRSNDTASVLVSVGAEPQTLVVNEIMYDPLADQNEWVEFYHRGTTFIDIANWRFRDRPTAGGAINTFVITTQSRTVQPGDFVVVAAESTILRQFPHLIAPAAGVHLFILNRSAGLSFGNSGDDVVLQDFSGQTIDSVAYLPQWHHPDVFDTRGRSLERINPHVGSNDPRNWSTSTVRAGGTPGLPNSILTTSRPSSATLSISPNPFSPDGDGNEDFCVVRYTVPYTTPTVSVRIFDIRGRLIRTLANAEVGGATGEVIWNGLEDSGLRARLGAYVVLLEAVDATTGETTAAKTVVVVGGSL